MIEHAALLGDFPVEVEAGGGFCGERLGRDGEFVVQGGEIGVELTFAAVDRGGVSHEIGIDLVFTRVVGEGDPLVDGGELILGGADLDADAGEALFGGVDVGFDGVEVEAVGEEWLECGVEFDDVLAQPVAEAMDWIRLVSASDFESAMAHASSIGEGVIWWRYCAPTCRGSYESAVWRREVRVWAQAQGA